MEKLLTQTNLKSLKKYTRERVESKRGTTVTIERTGMFRLSVEASRLFVGDADRMELFFDDVAEELIVQFGEKGNIPLQSYRGYKTGYIGTALKEWELEEMKGKKYNLIPCNIGGGETVYLVKRQSVVSASELKRQSEGDKDASGY